MWGCKGQRLDVRVVGKGVTKEIPPADLYRLKGRLHTVSPHNYFQALITHASLNRLFLERCLVKSPWDMSHFN